YPSSSSAASAKLAAVVPVCGTCQMSNANNIAVNNIGVYAFHASNDTRVSANCSINPVNSINAANPKNKALLQIYATGGHVIWDMAYDTGYAFQNPNVFEWMLGQNKGLSPNKIPVSNAGNDITISTSTATVTLSGNGTDADGSIVRYIWKKISGPAAGNIKSVSSNITAITSLTTAGSYVYELKVVDNRGSWSTDQVTVNVTTGTVVANKAPVSNAGADKSITLPTSSTTLSGSGTDADGTIASYAWTKISGPAGGTFSSTTTASTTISGLTTAGTYVLRLTVKDNGGATGYDDVSVTVNAATTTNNAPVANAGTDKNIILPTSTTTLSGSGTDSDGSIASYAWTKISGPAGGSFSSTTTASTNISNLTTAGTYVFRLTVKDNDGATAYDDVNVNVNNATTTNAAPVARAGNDANVTTSSYTLDGSASSDDKAITNNSWTQLAGPTNVTYTDRYSIKTVMNGMTKAGTYRFRLRVWDAEGLISVDDVSIIVGTSTGTSGGGSTSTSDNSTSTSSETVTINPNPVTKLTANCYVSSATNGNIKISILTTGGTLIKEVSYLKSVTDYKVGLDVSNLAAGTYVVKVLINGTKSLSTQMVRQ
ncbi:MAG: PKD domain-containing protein, partial [Flavitalea sp.]